MCDLTDHPDNLNAEMYCLQEKEWGYDGTLTHITEPIVYECKASCMIETSEWHYWKLPCGHIYHTRCIQMHLFKKRKLNCCLCGDLEVKEWYCDLCNEKGHYKWSEHRGTGCFFNEVRGNIIDRYNTSGIKYTIKHGNSLGIASSNTRKVIDIYLRLNRGEIFNWRRELSTIDCSKDPHINCKGSCSLCS